MEVAQNASEFNPAGYGVVAKGDVVTVTPEAAEEQAAKEHYKVGPDIGYFNTQFLSRRKSMRNPLNGRRPGLDS